MPRKRLYLDMSCVDAARKRIRHVYDTFDTVCVQFSGGKDSTAVLYLAKEVHDERGLGPVKTIFRDDEVVSPMVIDFVEKVRNYDWVDMEWYCLSVGMEVWSMGKRTTEIAWSKKREDEGRLVRPMPPFAISAESFGLSREEHMGDMDHWTMQGKKGRTAFITGVRANESMVRYRSLVQKLHENYIVVPYRAPRNLPLRLAKVIYDWTTDDVLKFVVEEHGGEYCEYYDAAAMTGSNTRVGSPLYSTAARRMKDLLATEPFFFDQLQRVWPMIDAQRRLWVDYDVEKLIMDYSRYGWDGVKACIDDNMIDESHRQYAMSFAAKFRMKMRNDPKSYPIHWLIRTLLLNEFSAVSPTPMGPGTKAYGISIRENADKENE